MYCFKNSCDKILVYMDLIFFPHKIEEQELHKPHRNHKYLKTCSGENCPLESTDYFDS